MVIISNGFSKFHLAFAAEELFNRSYLSMFLTGAYPTQNVRKMLSFGLLRKSKKLLRLEARGQNIDNSFVVPFWFTESLHTIGLFLRKKSLESSRIVDLLNNKSIMAYGRQTIKHVLKAAVKGARIYHYRSGFGQESVQVAKDNGMVTVCDHSIAYPALLEYLITNNGSFPQKGKKVPINSFWKQILNDIKRADYVLVNSDFVKETFLHYGWPSRQIKVIYLGVDDQFLSFLDECPPLETSKQGPLRILFAGDFGTRKGAEVLRLGLKGLEDVEWHLTIAGGMSKEMNITQKSFLSDSRVKYKGLLSRKELARCMKKSDVFVFPSLAEGSARVVFEALAAGCYVITTPNSGSIVQDGVHGRLVPPGNAETITAAIRDSYESRDQIRSIGKQNARLIRTEYRQVHYGDKLIELYKQLLETDKQI